MPEKYTLREAIRLLRADNKTFQRWLEEASITPEVDRGDKRKKLLTHAQLEQLAVRYGRTLPPESTGLSLLVERYAALKKDFDRQQRAHAGEMATLQERLREVEEALAAQKSVADPPTANQAEPPPTPQQELPSRGRSNRAGTGGTVAATKWLWNHFLQPEQVEQARQRLIEQNLITRKGPAELLARDMFHQAWEACHDLDGFLTCVHCPHR